MAIVWIIAGLLALIAGAELIVRGATRVAARVDIPPILIGLTIVSVGTITIKLALGIEAASHAISFLMRNGVSSPAVAYACR